MSFLQPLRFGWFLLIEEFAKRIFLDDGSHCFICLHCLQLGFYTVFSNCLQPIDVASSELANASVWAFNLILLPDIHIFLASECIHIKTVRYFLITIGRGT